MMISNEERQEALGSLQYCLDENLTPQKQEQKKNLHDRLFEFNQIFVTEHHLKPVLALVDIDEYVDKVRYVLQWIRRSAVWLLAVRKQTRICGTAIRSIMGRKDFRESAVQAVVKKWTEEMEAERQKVRNLLMKDPRKQTDKRVIQRLVDMQELPRDIKDKVVRELYFRKKTLFARAQKRHAEKLKVLRQSYMDLKIEVEIAVVQVEESKTAFMNRVDHSVALTRLAFSNVDDAQKQLASMKKTLDFHINHVPKFNFTPESIPMDLLMRFYRHMLADPKHRFFADSELPLNSSKIITPLLTARNRRYSSIAPTGTLAPPTSLSDGSSSPSTVTSRTSPMIGTGHFSSSVTMSQSAGVIDRHLSVVDQEDLFRFSSSPSRMSQEGRDSSSTSTEPDPMAGNSTHDPKITSPLVKFSANPPKAPAPAGVFQPSPLLPDFSSLPPVLTKNLSSPKLRASKPMLPSGSLPQQHSPSLVLGAAAAISGSQSSPAYQSPKSKRRVSTTSNGSVDLASFDFDPSGTGHPEEQTPSAPPLRGGSVTPTSFQPTSNPAFVPNSLSGSVKSILRKQVRSPTPTSSDSTPLNSVVVHSPSPTFQSTSVLPVIASSPNSIIPSPTLRHSVTGHDGNSGRVSIDRASVEHPKVESVSSSLERSPVPTRKSIVGASSGSLGRNQGRRLSSLVPGASSLNSSSILSSLSSSSTFEVSSSTRAVSHSSQKDSSPSLRSSSPNNPTRRASRSMLPTPHQQQMHPVSGAIGTFLGGRTSPLKSSALTVSSSL